MTSFSVYPDSLDGYGTLPLVRDGVNQIRARDHNSLRDAIIKIEYELGAQPSGVFGTVVDRLDSVTDAAALISAHIADTVDAHDASAISLLDTDDNYVAVEVEGALSELSAALPPPPDVVGVDNSAIPNSGIPTFVSKTGRLHVYNTDAGVFSILQRTQPISITGVHIFDVGLDNGTGLAELNFTTGPTSLAWKGPGDGSFGTAVDVSSAVDGTLITLTSVSGKGVRVSVDTTALDANPQSDAFELIQMDAAAGNYSLTGTGIVDSSYVTRTAISSTDTSRLQFMISGTVYPADKGTLVLQRKLRLSADTFTALAVLDLSAQFEESTRETSQLAYTPTLASFDTISLFDVHPVRNDYETLDLDADGNAIYDNYSVTSTFISQQIGKYIIPASNHIITSGELEVPADITAAEIDGAVSAYRMVHYVPGVTVFDGEPAEADIFSLSDPFAGVNDGDSNVRMSNVIVDNSTTRPGFGNSVVTNGLEITPISATESVSKIISGIHYYNSSADVFDVDAESDSNVFNSTYLKAGTLRFDAGVFVFPSGIAAGAFGDNVDVLELEDATTALYTNSNLPDHTTVGKDLAIYRTSVNSARRIYPDGYQFSSLARITGAYWDSFGAGSSTEAAGNSSGITRVLVNSFNSSTYDSNPRSDGYTEWFTDEDFRVGTAEGFTTAAASETDFAASWVSWSPAGLLTTGELQVGGVWTVGDTDYPGLVFPQDDYSSAAIAPTQSVSANYSTAFYDEESIYQRLFNIGYSTNGGRLNIKSSGSSLISFNDLDASNSTRPVKVEVKIPGAGNNSTGWLDIGKLFENNKFSDGDGALNGEVAGTDGDITIPFTFGPRNTGDTFFMIAVRVTLGPGVSIGSPAGVLSDAESKIMSYIELLSV